MIIESARSAIASTSPDSQADSFRFLELLSWFQTHAPPYTPEELWQLSSIYEQHRRYLSLGEKRQIQALLDDMIRGMD